MKNFISIFLALTLVFTFAACTKTTVVESEVNTEIEGYFNSGYECTMYSIEDGTFTAILELDGSYIKVTSPITSEQETILQGIEISDPDSNEQEEALIETFLDAKCETITPPSDEELSVYVGKTINDLIAAGFDEMFDENYDEESYEMVFYGTEYNVKVTVTENVNGTNVDDFSENQKKAFEIASVTFVEFVL